MKNATTFHDKNNIKFTVETELNERNGKKVFTASATYSGGGGQCLDSIVAANDAQTELVKLWEEWHLNDLNTGCKHQQKDNKDFAALPTTQEGNNTKINASREQIEKLLENKETCTVCGWNYGGGWYFNELPNGFEDTLKYILKNIEVAEKEHTSEKVGIAQLMEENNIDEDQEEAVQQAVEKLEEWQKGEASDVEEGEGFHNILFDDNYDTITESNSYI